MKVVSKDVKTVATPINSEASNLPARNQNERKNLFRLIRIMYLSYYASTGSLVPYLPVYYHSLGHGGHIIGVLSALRPFINFLVAPLWGMLADYSHDTLICLKIAAVGSIIGYLAIGWYTNIKCMMMAVIITSIFYAPVKSLMDSMVLERLAALENDKESSADKSRGKQNQGTSEFGKLRLFGPLGFGLGCSIAGVTVTHQKELLSRRTVNEESSEFSAFVNQYMTIIGSNLKGYKILFFIFGIISIPILVTIFSFPKNICLQNTDTVDKSLAKATHQVSNESGVTQIVRGLATIIRNYDALLFFFLVLMIGINYGAVETFCYVRMREVGATGQQIGFSRLVSAVAGTPMFWFSGRLTTIISGRPDAGAEQVLLLSLLGFAFRFLVYALARSPLDALPAEAIRGITFAAFYSTASTYAHRLSPPGLNSTMLMIMNSLYGGLGQSMGSMLAGRIQSRVGTVQMFLTLLQMDLVLIALLVIVYLALAPRSNNKKL